ncbi:hypothetical protein AC579_4210 [Pseudocercospora musae]|uniref:Uncharacterized protein n=1 Tax=Pseudocercospora musae TaxID=113226 RepID=A0A139ID03_9PEZI|nr:hypothetical protein AC579_4210 [Pseudocercospora musae]
MGRNVDSNFSGTQHMSMWLPRDERRHVRGIVNRSRQRLLRGPVHEAAPGPKWQSRIPVPAHIAALQHDGLPTAIHLTRIMAGYTWLAKVNATDPKPVGHVSGL